MKYYILLIAILLNACTKPQTNMNSDFENLFDNKFADHEPGEFVLLKKGDVKIEKSQKIMIPENWESTESSNVGYSWFIAESEDQSNDLGVKVISHTGWQGGFRAFYISIPEKDILFVG